MRQEACCTDLRKTGDVLYRHSGTDETMFARPGEELPERRQMGVWEPLAADNIKAKDAVPIIVERGLGIFMFMSDSIPNVGDVLNLRNPEMETQARYQVKKVGTTNVAGKEEISVEVVAFASMDACKLIYTLIRVE